MSLLEITNVTKDFGGLEALSNVSMHINTQPVYLLSEGPKLVSFRYSVGKNLSPLA